MSIPKFKRKPSGLDYVDNAFELQKDIMNLASNITSINDIYMIVFLNKFF